MARVWVVQHGKVKRFRNKRHRCTGWCGKRKRGRPSIGKGCKCITWDHERLPRFQRKLVHHELRGYSDGPLVSEANVLSTHGASR